MSGDVQPRKRKDKKRKKEESTDQVPPQFQTPSTPPASEDINIHVHKDEGTGGGICAKIVFFFLFSALAVLIGLIITEHRGLTDLDTVDTESRFSQIFEGWIDNSVGHDDHDDHLEHSLEHDEDDHDEHGVESREVSEGDEHDEHEEEVSDGKSHADDEEDATEEDEEQEITEESVLESEEDAEQEDDEEEDESVTKYDEDEEEEQEPSDEQEEQEESEEQELEPSEEQEASEEQEISEEQEASEEAAEDDEEDAVNSDSKEPAESQEEQETVDDDDDDDADDKPEESTENDVEDQAHDDDDETPDNQEDIDNENAEDNSRSVNVHPDNEPEESDSDRQSDDVDTYEYENITNKDDWQIKEKLDEAQKTSQNNAAYAIKLFDVLLKNYPSSPRSLYGKAQALDLLADQRRSNDILQQAIATYLQVLKLEYIPDALFQAAADRCVNRMRFIGRHNQAIDVHNLLIQRFPHDPKHLNQLTITCLTANRVNKARTVLIETLRKYPEDGLALVHYGFILKTTDNNLNESVVYLKKGIKSKEPGVIDGRFYFHLGDALSRLGRNEEAMKIYEEAVHYKLFLSKYQRSLYNVPHLKPQPWWSKEETPYDGLYLALEQNWKQIRDEGLAVLSEAGRFENESENLRDTGDWKQFELFARGQKNVANCKKCPITCKIINSVPDARGCKRGQTKFSVMHPETHVWPHCGPTNCRLRIHLGLQVPPDTYIRVTDEIRSWENGKVLIFDDSFEHEVWHNGTTFRLILIVDVWHPELTANQKRSLPAI